MGTARRSPPAKERERTSRLSVLFVLALLAGCTSHAPERDAPATAPAASADPRPSEPTTTAEAERPANDTPAPAPASSNATTPAPARNATAAPEAPRGVVVAVLDTGVLATHATFAPGQIVAWYDFTHAGPTDPGTAWDATVAPYDDNGHGTAVASMIGGTSGRQTPSHAPGVRLAVAKISQKDGSATWETVHRAMRWAVNVAHADVISLSFYTYVPTPGSGTELLSALREARSAGALPVVLAGNGLGNVGIPTESWLGAPGASRAALVVGGSRADGSPVAPLGSMDPEVTALYDVTAACPKGDACYAQESGTSFSTPLVAGIAARALDAARTRGGAPVGPDELEWQIKACASDTNAPPDLEGYGVMDASAAACVVQHALRGSMTRPDPNSPNALYVEQVEGTERASSPAG